MTLKFTVYYIGNFMKQFLEFYLISFLDKLGKHLNSKTVCFQQSQEFRMA